LEKTIAQQDHQLLINYEQTAADPNFFDAYQNNKKELDALMVKWESISNQLN